MAKYKSQQNKNFFQGAHVLKKQLSTEEKYTLLDYKYKVKTHRSTIWATIGALVGFLSVAVYVICHITICVRTNLNF